MQLALSENAKREYKKIPKREQVKIKRRLIAIENDPYLGKKLAGELAKYYSVRVWPYRIVYIIDKGNQIVWVNKIQHRQGAYK